MAIRSLDEIWIDANFKETQLTNLRIGQPVDLKLAGFAHRFAKGIHAGMIWINCYKRAHPGSPFGGFGESGYGREMGFEAMRDYTQPKSVWVNVDANIPPFYRR